MTPEEHAENIVVMVRRENTSATARFQIAYIASQIRKATEEAKREKQEFYDEGIKDAYREGRADACEEAANLVMNRPWNDGQYTEKTRFDIACEIRALAAEVTKK